MANPVLNKITKNTIESETSPITLETLLQKISALAVLTLSAVYISWQIASPAFFLLTFITLPLLLITAFKPLTANYLAIPYAILQGLVLGTFARIMENSYPQIAQTALTITSIIFITLLFAYAKLNLRLSQRAKNIVIISTSAIALYYLFALSAALLNSTTSLNINPPLLYSNSIYGILFTLFIAGIAASNFLLDFERIEQSILEKTSKDYEWALSMGLLVTFIWLYIEILRLLSKLRSND